jgi:hypothetical protein
MVSMSSWSKKPSTYLQYRQRLNNFPKAYATANSANLNQAARR